MIENRADAGMCGSTLHRNRVKLLSNLIGGSNCNHRVLCGDLRGERSRRGKYSKPRTSKSLH